MAVLFIILGLYCGDYIICFIGLFVFIMARQEYKMVKTESYLNDHKVGDIARSHFTKISTNDPMSHSFDLIQQGLEKNFLVYNEVDEVSGTLYEKDILSAMKNGKGEQPIQDFYKNEIESINAENSLRAAYNKMMSTGLNILPVIENNQIVGVIDVASINNFIRVKNQTWNA